MSAKREVWSLPRASSDNNFAVVGVSDACMKILEVLVRVTELLYFLHSSDCLPSEVTPSLRCLVVRLQHGTRRSTAEAGILDCSL